MWSRPRVRPSQDDLNMLHGMMNSLSVHDAYRQYPPYGVPCSEGVSTFQIDLKREQWLKMLLDFAAKERQVLGQAWRSEHEYQQGMQEGLQRTDSANVLAEPVKSLRNEREEEHANEQEAGKRSAGPADPDSSEEEEEAEISEQGLEKNRSKSGRNPTQKEWQRRSLVFGRRTRRVKTAKSLRALTKVTMAKKRPTTAQTCPSRLEGENDKSDERSG